MLYSRSLSSFDSSITKTIEFDGKQKNAGGTLTLSDQQSRQTIYIETAREEGLTGTIVTLNKPISVFAGHICGCVPANCTGCNHPVEQIPFGAQHFLLSHWQGEWLVIAS